MYNAILLIAGHQQAAGGGARYNIERYNRKSYYHRGGAMAGGDGGPPGGGRPRSSGRSGRSWRAQRFEAVGLRRSVVAGRFLAAAPDNNC